VRDLLAHPATILSQRDPARRETPPVSRKLTAPAIDALLERLHAM